MSDLDASNSSPRDLDLANIFYVQNIPVVPDNKKNELDARIRSIDSWIAWELTRVEDQVDDKVKKGQLPADDSVASMSKRTAYRSKVATFTRGASPWLPMVSTMTNTSNITAGADNINLSVMHTILDVSGSPDSPQVLNVVKAVGTGCYALEQMVQPHAFYVIDYSHDTVSDTITANIKTFLFNVVLTEASPPAAQPAKSGFFSHGSPTIPSKGKFYNAAIDYTNTSVKFDFTLWDQNAPQDQTAFALGQQLLSHKQLRLLN